MGQRRDTRELVTAGAGTPITFWRLDSQPIKPSMEIDYPYKILSLDISPSGSKLAFGTETNEVFVYNLGEHATFAAKGVGHSAPVTAVKWTPDEKQLISGSVDASVSIWNYFA